jgi:O-antigen/teichoic acid export membrane protein
MDDYSHLSFKSLIIRFVKNSSTYGLFRFISQFGAFIIIPIYWRYLSPKDYGILALTGVLQGVLAPIIIFGLNSSVERFYYEWREDEKEKKLCVIWICSCTIATGITLVIDSLGSNFFPLIFKQVPYYPYFKIALWSTFFASFSMVPFNLLRITERVNTYGIVSVCAFITSSSIILFLLIFMKLKVLGVLIGGLVSNAIWAVFWTIWMFKRMRFNINIFSIKDEILYAIPTLPINVIESIGNNFDRYLLEKYLSLKQLGLYSVANRFGTYFSQLNSALKTAWFPMTYKLAAQRSDLKKILPRLSMFYFLVLSVFALASALLLEEIIYWFGREKFIGAYKYVPAFILIYLILNFRSAWARGLDLAKKPEYTLLSVIPSVGIGVFLLYQWIPMYGTSGAIGALLVSSILRTSILVGLAHFFYPRKFLFKEVTLLFISLGLFFYAGYLLPFDNLFVSFCVKMAIIAAYSVLGSIITFGYGNVWKGVIDFILSGYRALVIRTSKGRELG